MREWALSLASASFVPMPVTLIIPPTRGERAKVKSLFSKVEVPGGGDSSPGVVLSAASVSPSPETQGTRYEKRGEGDHSPSSGHVPGAFHVADQPNALAGPFGSFQ